jgi:DNA-binding response OmpR family regulator
MLLVEDDRRLADLVADRLRDLGHEVETANDGDEGLRLANSGRFNVAVLDVMLPGRDGLSVLDELRGTGDDLPVLLLTAKDTVPDRVDGLRRGADDYLVKPFAFDELVARVEAVARRSSADPRLVHGPIAMDREARRVWADGEEVDLTAKEFDLLRCFLENDGRVLTRAELKERVWDFEFDAQTKVVDLYVHYLRRKLGPAGDRIHTVRGVGYVLGR